MKFTFAFASGWTFAFATQAQHPIVLVINLVCGVGFCFWWYVADLGEKREKRDE